MDINKIQNDKVSIGENQTTQSNLALRIGVVATLSFVLDITFRLMGFFSISGNVEDRMD